MEEDSSLVERSCTGDERAIEELVMKYQRKIYAFIYRMTGDAEDAKDLTQTTFMNAVRGMADFKGRSSFRTWLYQIALNASRNHLVRRQDERAEVDERLASGEKGALTVVIERERRERVRQALDRLPERQRLCVVLRVYDGLSCAETAEVMGCSEGAVKAHYHHAVKNMRETLKEQGYELKA